MEEPTVKIGTTVYITQWWKNSILVGQVESVYGDNSVSVSRLHGLFTLGKNAFLSEEEAGQVVKRLVVEEIELAKKQLKTKLVKLEKFKHKFKPV